VNPIAATRRRLSPEDRRSEIIAATIDTVAALGYRATTFAKITERSGLSSTRLISYHFAGRDELMQATVAHVYQQIGDHLGGRLASATRPRAQLAAYIRAVVEFNVEHRTEMRALSSIFLGYRDESGESRSYDADSDERAIGAVEQILLRGQAEGTFRAFDAFVMGSLVQRSVDGLPFLLETRPDLDLGAYADELVETFDIATRS
jgi:AcrR family transcriptional regulator